MDSTPDIKLYRLSNLHARILASPSIFYEMKDKFSFYVEGYKFMPLYKKGLWDGKISMIDIKNKRFYIGLIPRLKSWAKDAGYTLSIEEALTKEIDTEDEVSSWLQNDIPSLLRDDLGYTPDEYQTDAVKNAMLKQFLLIKSPTGSGKSLIIYLMVRRLLEITDKEILITVPTTGLVEQLESDFRDYAGSKWDVDANVAKIYSGKEKTTKHRVKISTWQSLFRNDAEYFERFGAYICDEAHGADAKSISSIIEKCSNSVLRIGLTGTTDGTKVHEIQLTALFGPIYVTKTTSELIDMGRLTKVSIEAVVLKHNPEKFKGVLKSYDDELNFAISSHDRLNLVANLALSKNKNTLILVNFVEKHGDKLYELLKEKIAKRGIGKQLFYLKGDVDVDVREEVRRIMELHDDVVVVATVGVFSTGTNVKNLHHLLMAHPYKSQIKVLQSIGRTVRKLAGKDGCEIIDIVDDMSTKKRNGDIKMNTLMEHFVERLKIYEQEQFPVKIVKVKGT